MIYIGIDPDVDKSGFAVWDSRNRTFKEIETYGFFDLIQKMNSFDSEIQVVIEAGWLISKSNFHGRKGQPKSVGEKIAKSVGANHQVGKLFVEWCRFNNIRFREIKPQGKINSVDFKRLTGWPKRTNSEQRDSAMLIFGS
mgnify:CR=1 FL=1